MPSNDDPVIIDSHLLVQAERHCRQKLDRDPGNRALLASLGDVYRKMGKLDEAALVFEQLVRLDPEDAEARYLHAVFAGNGAPPARSGSRAAPFVLIRDFLPRDFHDSLLPFLLSVQDKFVPADFGNHRVDSRVRDNLEYLGEWEGRKGFRERLLKILPQVLVRLEFSGVPIGCIEITPRAYLDGHFYQVHQDAPPQLPRVRDRLFNYVYYFHKVPKPYSGGELLVFDSDTKADTYSRNRFTCVVPEDNCIIFFPCRYWHSVVRVQCPSKEFADSRFAINGCVHRRVEAAPAESGLATAVSPGTLLNQ
jgi:Rps23 Pro-64 3,4-dihydroxylase Tpa1-like proline 4-hydroxylase